MGPQHEKRLQTQNLTSISNAMTDVPVGYQHIRQIGQGLCSTVLLCERPDGTQVCLKNVRVDGMQECAFLAMFFYFSKSFSGQTTVGARRKRDGHFDESQLSIHHQMLWISKEQQYHTDSTRICQEWITSGGDNSF